MLELAASAPIDVKYRGRTPKWLLKEAFREDLPPEILRRRKQGFEVPIQRWLRGPLLPLARELLQGPDVRLLGYLRPAAVSRLIDRHAEGTASYGRQLWALLMLELWHREVVEAPASAGGAAGPVSAVAGS